MKQARIGPLAPAASVDARPRSPLDWQATVGGRRSLSGPKSESGWLGLAPSGGYRAAHSAGDVNEGQSKKQGTDDRPNLFLIERRPLR